MNIETLKKGYINNEEIEKYLTCDFTKKFIEETVKLFDDDKIENKKYDISEQKIKKIKYLEETITQY